MIRVEDKNGRREYRHPEQVCEVCGNAYLPRKTTQRWCTRVCYTNRRPSEASFWRRTQATSNGCLEWTGKRYPNGYGAVSWGRLRTGTHRLAWMLTNGPIPAGMHVLHRCDNPPCVNPDHLWLGTNADNLADMARKGRGRNQHTGPLAQLDADLGAA